MRYRVTFGFLLSIIALALLVACGSKPERIVEVGRWADDRMFALFIAYHMSTNVSEAELKQLQKQIARQQAADHPFVIQVTVYDLDWARRLASEEMRRRIANDDPPVGSDLVINEAMSIRGGLVYTYYREGDHDEFIYHERPADQLPR